MTSRPTWIPLSIARLAMPALAQSTITACGLAGADMRSFSHADSGSALRTELTGTNGGAGAHATLFELSIGMLHRF
jgi:hypothetical protein